MTSEEIVATLVETESRSKSNTKRLDKMEQRQDEIDELVTSVALMAQKQQVVELDVKEIKIDVKELKEKPAKKWESLAEKVLWAIVGAALAYIMASVGLA